MLEVRVLPWRPRARVMNPKDLRDGALDNVPLDGADDPAGIVLVFGIWLAIIVAAPLMVLLIAGALLSIEVPLVLLLAVLLLLARFTGVIPWTVSVADAVAGAERKETYRSIVRARRRVREINGKPRVPVRWSWV